MSLKRRAVLALALCMSLGFAGKVLADKGVAG